MLKVEHLKAIGWEAAIRGMRNPLNSWGNSDTEPAPETEAGLRIGEKDLDLMHRLWGGPCERKYLRMITIQCDITGPLYWWKEFDTYKVGTVANSCSTMHKIHSRRFVLDDFSTEHLDELSIDLFYRVIDALNESREAFLATRSKDAWWQMIQLLPSSYNQLRTVQFNYEVAAQIVKWRSNHKLDEWHTLCDALLGLPYAEDLIKGERT